MANDHLYVANWRRRYELLNTKVLDHRTNLLKIEREQSKALADPDRAARHAPPPQGKADMR